MDSHKEEFGVEPICRVLSDSGCQIAPSTYYASKGRGLSARALADQALDERIVCLRAQGFNQALGSRKTWRLLNAQQGHDPVARCTVERRMRALGISGIGPGRKIRTTRPAACAAMPPDLLGRDFTAAWVDWYNHTRPHRTNPDDLPPAAAEDHYHHTRNTATAPAAA